MQHSPPSNLAAQRSSFLRHPFILIAVVALSGSVAPLAPGPSAAVALGWSIFVFAARLHNCSDDSQRSRTDTARSILAAMGLALLFITCGTRATSAVHEFESEYFRVRTALPGPRRCAGSAVITQSPTRRSQSEKAGEMVAVTLFTGTATSLDCEGLWIKGPVSLRIYGGPEDLSRGDRVEFIAQLASTRLFRNAGLPNPWPGAARRTTVLSGSALVVERLAKGRGLYATIDRLRAHVRARILATYSPRSAQLGRALVLGESDLDEEDSAAFKESGLLHLLAVSGTHLVIAVFALVQGLRALLIRCGPLARRYDVSRVSSALGAVLSLLYADFSGGSGSAWRAAFMLCLVCGGRAAGVRVTGPAALGGSLLIGLALEPLAGSDYSFLLSALATSGLIGLGQPLTNLCTRGIFGRTPLRQLVSSFIATISSTIPCAPVLSMMDGKMTAAALFANVLAGPLGELIALPVCLLHAISSPWPILEQGLGIVGSGALYGVRGVALWSASVEQAQFSVAFPSPWNIALAATTLLSVAFIRELKNRSLGVRIALCASLFATAAILSPALPTTSKEASGLLAVTALDVEQGDALFLEFPDGKVGLMDGGGFATGVPDTGERVVLPYLRSRGVKHLDVMILSHPHPDHLLGLLSVAREVSVGELWIPGYGVERKEALSTLIARTEARGARTRTSNELCGDFDWGGARISVLAPCSPSSPPLGLNDASLVLKIALGKRAALLTGDIEKRGEATILGTSREKLRADLLKVAHHGSDTSSTLPFVEAVQPTVAFISSGVRNTYDHPRPLTLATLSERNIAVLRTDRLGSNTWFTDGKIQGLRSFSAAPPTELLARWQAELYRKGQAPFHHGQGPSSSDYGHEKH